MSEHVDRATLAAYVFGDDDIDRSSIIRHVFACDRCHHELDDIQQLVFLIRDRDVLEFLASRSFDRDRADLRANLTTIEQRQQQEEREAREVVGELMTRPVDTWDSLAGANAAYRSAALMNNVLSHAEAELDRRPKHALLLLDFVERWTRGDSDGSRILLGDVWKNRSNALRQLMRYSEALSAAEMAEALYSSVRGSEFNIGQARLTYAVTLVKMNRYADATRALDRADELLVAFGDTVPSAKSTVLRSGILFQEGDFERAEHLWRGVLPSLEHLGDDVERARVTANLAECARLRGEFDQALKDANSAIREYDALGMDTERIRAEWTIANVDLGRGDHVNGLHGLHDVASKFAALGMVGDEGFVKMDIAEELLRRRDWKRAAEIARELVDLFTRAGVTVASVEALQVLRVAVEHEQATVSLLQRVRDYVAADDAGRAFVPPS